MTYATESDLRAAFSERELTDVADRDGDGFADPDVLALALARADGIVDSYLRSRFALPLAETPDLVRECALAVARHILAKDHPTDRIKGDYERALAWLKEIREGKMDVGLTPADAAAPATSGGPQTSGGRPVFDRDALDAWSGSCE